MRAPAYAAVDLGTNNCRLLIARPTAGGFEVVDSFSRIVRLGEGLAASGELQPEPMERALSALWTCAAKIRRAGVGRTRAVATQAARAAANGPEFLRRAEEEAGIRLEVIDPEEEARLSVASCADLLDCDYEAALVLDVGGGSTELSWLDLRRFGPDGRPRVVGWRSLPLGVVSLAEARPEGEGGFAWWRGMVDIVRDELDREAVDESLHRVFAAGRGHLIGASGAITSLAGVHLNLPRYRRERVDGLWIEAATCDAVTRRLIATSPVDRASHPCIGPERADLILAGAAILQAVLEAWPSSRMRVADRGLREGLLLEMMAGDRAAGFPRRAHA